MDAKAPTVGRTGLNTPNWIVVASLATGGLFAFVWLAMAGRRAFHPGERSRLLLIPGAALLWVVGVAAMVRGALLPTQPGASGNPLFFAGFVVTLAALVLLYVYNLKLLGKIVPGAPGKPLRGRLHGTSLAVIGVLIGQLAREITPLRSSNEAIVDLFQFMCLIAAAVLGIQWVERFHPKMQELRPKRAVVGNPVAPTEPVVRPV